MLTFDDRIWRLPLALLFFLTLLLVFTSGVEAKSYSLDRVEIEARVEPDGSLRIDETRTYSFDGRYSWADYRLPLGRVGTVSEFSLSEGDRLYAEASTEEPGTYQLSLSPEELWVKWHYAADDETRSFRLRYRISDAVILHADVAEFYFQFVGRLNPQPLGQVEVNLQLPGEAIFGDVRAWAHGPLHGRVEVLDTRRLRLAVAPLPARQIWEARVTFPSSWVDAARLGSSGETALDRILAEEENWAHEANLRRERALAAAAREEADNRLAGWIAAVLAGIAVLSVLIGYLTAGRPHPVPYSQDIDSTLPDEPPALVSFFYYARHVYGAALGATLFDLARRGILSVEQDPKKKKWYESSAQFTLRLNVEQWARDEGRLPEYERSLIHFFFDEIAEGRDHVHSRKLRKAQRRMQRWFKEWKKEVRQAAGEYAYYDPVSKQATVITCIIAGTVLMLGIVLAIALGETGVIAIIAGAVCFLLSFVILRLTPEARLKRKKLDAFKRYLKRYHQRSGAGVGEHIGAYLVYGLALGVGSKAIERLFASLSEEHRAAYVPWYVHTGGGSPAEFASAMTSVVSATTSTVSSSAGAGGGASGGGGGGGGGAGGGAG